MIGRLLPHSTLSPIVKSSLALGVLTILCKILGYGEKLVLAYYFGTSYEVDVYNVVIAMAISVFILFRELIEPGFLHVFLRAFHHEDKASSWQLFRFFFLLIMLLTVAFSVICMLFSGEVMHIFAPGFSAEKAELAASMLQIVIPAAIFLSLSALTNITLNALKSFAMPMLGEVLFKLVVLACLFAFYHTSGIFSIAIGFLVGAFVKLAFHLFLLYKPIVIARSEHIGKHLREVWRLTWPLLVGVAFSQVSTLVDNIFASYQQEGAISALNYAKKLVDLPVLVFPYILSVVVFPYFSQLSIIKEHKKLADLFSKSLAWILVVFLPLALFFYMFSYELTAVALQRGAFTADSTTLTSVPLKYYALGMVFFAIETILVIFYFANADTKTPIFIGILTVLENILLTVIFLRIFGYAGIALSLVVAKATKNIVLLLLLKKMMSIDFRSVFVFLGKVGAAFVLTALGMFLLKDVFADVAHTSTLLFLMCIFSVSTVCYALCLYVFKLREDLF
ncbi:murein biosynthesis integral membrane protein MurJ [Sphingobacterium paludis]|uniref:Probable lipid II flippase MurJ n=1 Tax=Sphingobacterium paludis TaxID=1476465 RepID=A0A4R7CZQ2_9SPHI|nr:murein biosynthesis integral membrane protein MurJ [Sphingobacterium paludis]TDS13880.1 murein biosynthesis integral membrane protein MurJ [Sphingobacterium paludis]